MTVDPSKNVSFPMGRRILTCPFLSARFAFNPSTLTHKVHAVRTILPGEELTISCEFIMRASVLVQI
jgi:hypothetical protein